MDAKVKVKVVKTELNLTKIDKDNKSIEAQGEASLDGAIYAISNKDKELTRVEIKNNVANVSNLDFGTYYIKEIQPPTGYEPSTDIYKAKVEAYNYTVITKITGEDTQEGGDNPAGEDSPEGEDDPDKYSYKIPNTPIELTVKKVWVETQPSDQKPVYFKLYKKNSTEGSPDTEIIITDRQEITYTTDKGYVLDANNNWNVVFKPIEEGQYYVVEETLDGFFTKYAAIITEDYDDAVATFTPTEALAALTSPDWEGNLTILNKPDTGVDLEIEKVDKNNNSIKLPGAKFELRKIKDTGGASGIEYDDTFQSVEKTTNGNGEATFDRITSGYYEIREKEMPDGYVISDYDRFYIKNERGVLYLLQKEDSKDPKKWIPVDSVWNGDVQFTAATATAAASAQVKNTPGVKLPESGGPGTLLYTLGGLALVSASALMYGFRQRRRERRLN